MNKTVIYQLFPRFYSNTKNNNIKSGSIEENGCGKLNDINDACLDSIVALGVSHVWYTGVVRHASATSYPFMSHPANANVVKGKAGSPYAICDYYDIDPDLAERVETRMDEWRSLIDRSHRHGLRVLMDFVPNHVARNYYSDANPTVQQLGEKDNKDHAFNPSNNFYYLPGQAFVSPVSDKDVPYQESPAKVSGNDAFTASPSINDWYETVKLNYGLDYANNSGHYSPYPDTWYKMRDILLYWISTGVDGFRVDMAEMVPVEFWRWVINQVTSRHPNIIFVAETYQPDRYGEYISAGFNLLYDKCVFYDTVRDVVCQHRPASANSDIWRLTEYVGKHMLYFLENHDEQRLASDFFAGDARKGRAAYLLALTMGHGATMFYAGQELGERGMDEEGFSGRDGRTTIFDYWSVGSLSRNAQGLTYNDEGLNDEERTLKEWYAKANNVAGRYPALTTGAFYDLMWINQHISVDASQIYAYLRFEDHYRFLIVLNFSGANKRQKLKISDDAWAMMNCRWNECIQPVDMLGNALYIGRDSVNNIKERGLEVEIPAYDGIILRF